MQHYRIVEIDTEGARLFRLQRDCDCLAHFHFEETAIHTAVGLARVDSARGYDVLVSLERRDGRHEMVDAMMAQSITRKIA